ncbi:colicin D domain-containing protein [Lacrimispora sp.]|uniref:colicin D domain-containing protein n=1 Tax=Lacrimispora sp. TaxID=2719234 RepID=UPI0028A83552|nr:colicin D domain-containing protein [Lacrimispora sp.]
MEQQQWGLLEHGFEQARQLLQAQQMRVGEGAGKLNDIPQSKLQHEFKHAWDGNWNKANGESFSNTIKNHIINQLMIIKTSPSQTILSRL